MSKYTVRWVPIGPEIAVNCQTLDEAIAIADELVSIGRTERIRVQRDGADIPLDFDYEQGPISPDAEQGFKRTVS